MISLHRQVLSSHTNFLSCSTKGTFEVNSACRHVCKHKVAIYEKEISMQTLIHLLGHTLLFGFLQPVQAPQGFNGSVVQNQTYSRLQHQAHYAHAQPSHVYAQQVQMQGSNTIQSSASMQNNRHPLSHNQQHLLQNINHHMTSGMRANSNNHFFQHMLPNMYDVSALSHHQLQQKKQHQQHAQQQMSTNAAFLSNKIQFQPKVTMNHMNGSNQLHSATTFVKNEQQSVPITVTNHHSNRYTIR